MVCVSPLASSSTCTSGSLSRARCSRIARATCSYGAPSSHSGRCRRGHQGEPRVHKQAALPRGAARVNVPAPRHPVGLGAARLRQDDAVYTRHAEVRSDEPTADAAAQGPDAPQAPARLQAAPLQDCGTSARAPRGQDTNEVDDGRPYARLAAAHPALRRLLRAPLRHRAAAQANQHPGTAPASSGGLHHRRCRAPSATSSTTTSRTRWATSPKTTRSWSTPTTASTLRPPPSTSRSCPRTTATGARIRVTGALLSRRRQRLQCGAVGSHRDTAMYWKAQGNNNSLLNEDTLHEMHIMALSVSSTSLTVMARGKVDCVFQINVSIILFIECVCFYNVSVIRGHCIRRRKTETTTA